MIKGFEQVNVYVEGLGIVKKTIKVEDGKIVKICDCKDKDGFIKLPDNLIVVPGFIDEHIHGSATADNMDATLDAARTISKTIASEGVSSFLMTTMTEPEDHIEKAMVNAKNFIENPEYVGAKAIGLHLEGPFISVKHKGAQPEESIRKPNVEIFKHYQALSGNNIKEITFAYEEDGKALANYLRDTGVVGSIGHTDATCDQTLEAIKEGVSCATHTYNAMKPLHHREAGTVGACLLSNDIYCELICDLIHVSPNAIRLLYKCKGKEKIVLITDAMRAKHMPDGEYSLGGQPVFVKDGAARLENGTLAGSILCMNVALKNMQSVVGTTLEETIDFATANPAKNLHIFDKKGSIKEGKDADFAVIDKDFNVYMTVSEGHIVYKK
ncbi:MAG: N-acetylglucosamine-6-phosphate deacetylase [Bacilli bacterium]|nr:N-acetylglucosamine-6-phosphate deacetylase [Bacilli bacterium]